MQTIELKDFLKEMGLEGVHPKPTTKPKPDYMQQGHFNDPRDANGDVPF
tara:strand:+ start:570 stop:716 length:147 start_codon:yes stop_codon:yes gene_type:complete